MNIKYKYSLYEPCKLGSKYWINYFITKGADNWDNGLYGACDGGYIACEGEYAKIVKMFEVRATYNWDIELWSHVFYGACKRGDIKTVDLMMRKGVGLWNDELNCYERTFRGLQIACEIGH